MAGENKLDEAQIEELIQKNINNIAKSLEDVKSQMHPLSESLKAITAQEKLPPVMDGHFESLESFLSYKNDKNETVKYTDLVDSIKMKKRAPKNKEDKAKNLNNLLVDLNGKRAAINEQLQGSIPKMQAHKIEWERDLNNAKTLEIGHCRLIKNVIKSTLESEITILRSKLNGLVEDSESLKTISKLQKQPQDKKNQEQIANLQTRIYDNAKKRVLYDLQVKENILANEGKTVRKAKKYLEESVSPYRATKDNIEANKTNIINLEAEISKLQNSISRSLEDCQKVIIEITSLVNERLKPEAVEVAEVLEVSESLEPPAAPEPPLFSGIPSPSVGFHKTPKVSKKKENEQQAFSPKMDIGNTPQARLRATPVKNSEKVVELTDMQKVLLNLGKRDSGLETPPKVKDNSDVGLSYSAYKSKKTAKQDKILALEKMANDLETEKDKQPIYAEILKLQKDSIKVLEDIKQEFRLQSDELGDKNKELSDIKNNLNVTAAPAASLLEVPAAPDAPPLFIPEAPPLDLSSYLQKLVKIPALVLSPITKPEVKPSSGRLDKETMDKMMAESQAKTKETRTRLFLSAEALKIINQKQVDTESKFQMDFVGLVPELINPSSTAFASIANDLGKTPLELMPEKVQVELMRKTMEIFKLHGKHDEINKFAETAQEQEEKRQKAVLEERTRKAAKLEEEIKQEKKARKAEKVQIELKQIVTLNPATNPEEVEQAKVELTKAKVTSPYLKIFATNLQENRVQIDALSKPFTTELLEEINKVLELNQVAPLIIPPDDEIAELEEPPAPPGSDPAIVPHLPHPGSFFNHNQHGAGSTNTHSSDPLMKDRINFLNKWYRFGSMSLENTIIELGTKFIEKEDKKTPLLLYKIAMISRVARDDYLKNGNIEEFKAHLKTVIKGIEDSTKKPALEKFFTWIKEVFQGIIDAVTGKDVLNKQLNKDLKTDVLDKLKADYKHLALSPGIKDEPQPGQKPDQLAPKG